MAVDGFWSLQRIRSYIGMRHQFDGTVGRADAPVSNEERNIMRLLHPPRPTLLDRLRRVLFAAEEWWCRHVTDRELYRLLDRARLPPDWGASDETKPDTRP
ncbi:hypothetical protein [Streptomyces chrestomyceticus]|uniref:hypothetical protein n=1 Tax=Streptomyces chrestomyceticus TaxID=68185 RepID=UPI0033D1F45C